MGRFLKNVHPNCQGILTYTYNNIHVDLAKLINPVTINGQPVKFTSEFEHVEVLRNTTGNMPHIMNRIVEHKSGLSFVLSAGLARGRHGNPADSLKVHELWSGPVLPPQFSPKLKSQSLTTITKELFRTCKDCMTGPHTVFFLLLAGCLTGEAILHLKQLTLIMMVCHLPQDP